jgi:hypothetical protein
MKEADANIRKLEGGITTYTDVYAAQNQFFDDEIKVRARDIRLIKEAALAERILPEELAPNIFGGKSPAPAAASPSKDNPTGDIMTPNKDTDPPTS